MNDNLYQAQSAFVHRLKRIAVKYDVAVILVAHPRKTKENFTNDDVSGSGDITNRVDTVLAYSRNGDKHLDEDCDSHLVVTKNRLLGKLTKRLANRWSCITVGNPNALPAPVGLYPGPSGMAGRQNPRSMPILRKFEVRDDLQGDIDPGK